ncbi:MAG: histidine kinase [Anaerostipes sp.]|nr:histidine kinase [Anaerostipes sp.]
MIELIDNFIQLVVTTTGCLLAGALFFKNHKQPFFLLACFYGVYTLGTLYWTLHLLLFNETPPVFYVSDLAWIASYIFLLALLYNMRVLEHDHKTPLCWLALIFCIPQFILYITHGEVFYNIAMCVPTMLIGWLGIEGLVFNLETPGEKDSVLFYISVLCFVALEYCLWTASCFWMGDTLINPYFWFDILLSVSMLSLLPGLKKAVTK